MGLILRAVPAEKLDEAVREVVETLLGKHPTVLRHMKQLANATYKYAARQGLDLEVAVFQRHIVSAAAREGLAAFRERRQPRFPAGNSGIKETTLGRSDR